MKYSILSSIVLGVILYSCSVTKPVAIETRYETRYIDSLRIKDSIVIIPVERVVDIVPQYDTLKLETSLAESKAYVDTSLHMLRGDIKNKKGTLERIIYKDRVIERVDSVYVEVPKEVEVVKTKAPKILWWSLGFNILILLFLALKIWLKFK